MKTQKMLGLGIVSSLILSGASMADFYGLDYDITANDAVDGDANWTVRIYTVMDDGDRLDAVAGDVTNNKTLTTTGSFYQNAFGGPTSADINPALYGAFPSLVFDSWVTIGLEDNVGNALSNIGIDWTNFESGGDLSTDNGTWFVTPKDPQGEATQFTNQNGDSLYGTLVAQVTVFGSDAAIHMGAIFQGKDANGLTWGPTFAEIDIEQPSIIDCNENGVADDQDIANGTSSDCNGNGTPDECELDNGDCNENGILDECENFDDCNENGVPDECEEFGDCNDNGIPDECEDLQDWDGNGVADACEGLIAYNVSQNIGYNSYNAATSDASDNDIIWISGTDKTNLNYFGKSLHIYEEGGNDVSVSNLLLSNGGWLWSNHSLTTGHTISPASGTATLVVNGEFSTSVLNLRRGAGIDLYNTPLVLEFGGVMNQDSSLFSYGFEINGFLSCMSGSVIMSAPEISSEGSLTGTVDIFGSLDNAGTVTATDDIFVTEDLLNDGLVSMYRGTLYVSGDLTNNGTILGDVDDGPGLRGGDGPALGDGPKIYGSYIAGAESSMVMPDPNWKFSVGGNFDVAINDNARFDMSQATLEISNSGAASQEIEVLSTDLGGIEEALDPAYPGAFPIGTIQVKAGARSVDLVDARDNDGDSQELPEVMYATTLIVDSGATLNTNGYIVYVSDLINNGTIIGEDDVIIIDPPVLGDLTGDGIVGIDDLLIVISLWGPCDGCDADFDNNGDVGIDDLLVVIANWS